jgi:hypothetical protein
VCGIPPEVKAALGVEDGIVQSVTIVYTNTKAARVTVEFVPGTSNALAAKAACGKRWFAIAEDRSSGV